MAFIVGTRHRQGYEAGMESGKEQNMHVEVRSNRMAAVAAHPLAELLACPPGAGTVLTGSAQTIDFDAGQIIFRQDAECQGLYLVIAGHLIRRADRLETRLTLGTARAGELVELAAALGDTPHTYSLVAQSAGSLLLLPMAALRQAFQTYPPLRMRLLEELAREVSRAYQACCLSSGMRIRRRAAPPTMG